MERRPVTLVLVAVSLLGAQVVLAPGTTRGQEGVAAAGADDTASAAPAGETSSAAAAAPDEPEPEAEPRFRPRPRIGIRGGGGLTIQNGPPPQLLLPPDSTATPPERSTTIGVFGSISATVGVHLTPEFTIAFYGIGYFGYWEPAGYGGDPAEEEDPAPAGGDFLSGWFIGLGGDYILPLGVNALQAGLYVGPWAVDVCQPNRGDRQVVPANCGRVMPSLSFTIDFALGNSSDRNRYREGFSFGFTGLLGYMDFNVKRVGDLRQASDTTQSEVAGMVSLFVGYELY
ncbi:MAG: hypothetical protein ACFCGT_01335 [Sandaracinaceae bacterium]